MPADVVLEAAAAKQFEKAPLSVRRQLGKLARELAEDPQLGEYVPVADVYNVATVKKWTARVGKLQGLYKLELREGWRALYTIGSRGSARLVLILAVTDHKAYERLMGY